MKKRITGFLGELLVARTTAESALNDAQERGEQLSKVNLDLISALDGQLSARKEAIEATKRVEELEKELSDTSRQLGVVRESLRLSRGQLRASESERLRLAEGLRLSVADRPPTPRPATMGIHLSSSESSESEGEVEVEVEVEADPTPATPPRAEASPGETAQTPPTDTLPSPSYSPTSPAYSPTSPSYHRPTDDGPLIADEEAMAPEITEGVEEVQSPQQSSSLTLIQPPSVTPEFLAAYSSAVHH